MYYWLNCALRFLGIILIFISLIESTMNLTEKPGHLKKFGYEKSPYTLKEIGGFLDASEFFNNHVFTLTPLTMRGAAKLSPAFLLWTDSYFKELDVKSKNSKITVETMKKESRQQEVLEMDFHEFLKIYNNTEHYMVHTVPEFLRRDVVFPCSLQCQDLMTNDMVDNIMWYSSGGTKSVVHTDSADNINCVYRGEKEFVMIDPSRYKDKVDMDHPEGAYSGVDVDRVDFTLYPGLAEVTYQHVNLSAGDCLYIPYKWIHQVRSHGSNIAVNVWWNHHSSLDVDLTSCNAQCDLDLTLEDVEFNGFGDITNSIEAVRDQIEGFLGVKKMIDFPRFFHVILGNELQFLNEDDITVLKGLMLKMFRVLDRDKDDILYNDELKMATQEDWKTVQQIMKRIENVLDDADVEAGGGVFPDDEEEDSPNIKDEL